jgi:hypothetical protein
MDPFSPRKRKIVSQKNQDAYPFIQSPDKITIFEAEE